MGEANDVDLIVANQNSAVANDSELRKFFTDPRPLRSHKCDQLRRVKKSERLQAILLCTI